MITIKRNKCMSDFNRKYTVRIDDRKVCSLKNGETKTFELEQGMHTIKVSLDWCGSNVINFFYQPNMNLTFVCHSSLKGSNTIFSLKKMTVERDSYITLYQEKD